MSLLDEVPGAPTDDDGDPSAWELAEGVARSLHLREGSVPDTLAAVLRTAVEVVEPAHSAGVNLLVRGTFEPQAVHGGPPHRLDAWQQDHGDGPCIEASRAQAVLRVEDAASDPRWPGFGELATSLGVCSMLCVPLWVDAARLGSVSVYAAAPHAFTGRDETIAGLVATQAALALGDALRARQLRTMAANRDLIGQAKGILMERHKITADGAFDLLRVASQRANRKLVDVADTLVATGSL